MNILFIEMAFDGTVGGSHTCLYNLLSNLDREFYNLSVVVYQSNIFIDKLKNVGVEVVLLPRNPIVNGNVFIRKLRNWYRLIYRHRIELRKIILSRKVDVLILNNSVAGGNDFLHVCRKLNIPVIAYERGYIQYTASDISLSNMIDASIAVSNAIHNNMIRHSYSATTRVIYDGLMVNKTEATMPRTEIKKSIGIPDNSIVVGMIGNVREWKGQAYFVKAFMMLGKKYRNMYGLIVGGYGVEDREYIDHLKKLSINSESCDRLLYLGFRDDVPNLLQIMDIFVHASIKPEPFGMVLLEAMLQKVPVIATDNGGPVEILENGLCGILVPPRDEHAIADGVEKYLNNRLLRESMVNRARKRVEAEFNLQKTVSQVDNLLREVVGRASVGLSDIN